MTSHDASLNQTIQQAKQVPVLINYTVGKQRLEKSPDKFDRALLIAIENEKPTAWFPADRILMARNPGVTTTLGLLTCIISTLKEICFVFPT